VRIVLVVCVLAFPAAIGATTPIAPPAPAPSPVTEDLHGVEILDNYRGFERLDAATIEWIKSEGTYARSVLDSIPERAGLRDRLEAFQAQFALAKTVQRAGARVFYLLRDAQADDFDLVVRERNRVRKLVDIHAMRADGGAAYAINYYLASPDGSRVAVGISRDGTEDAVLRVYDVGTGKQIGGVVDRAQFGMLAWSENSATVFLNRLRQLLPAENPLNRYRETTVDAWNMREHPQTVFSRALLPSAGLSPTDEPQFVLPSASRFAFLRLEDGADPNIAIYVAPTDQVRSPSAWRPLVTHADGVTAFETSGSKVFLLSRANAPTFKVLELDIGSPLSSARTVIAPSSDRIIESIHAAADGLYVVARRRLYARLLRVTSSGAIQDLELPAQGQITEAFSDPTQPGIAIAFESWSLPSRIYEYRPGARSHVDLNLVPRPGIHSAPARVEDLEAPGLDQTPVPLTVILPHGEPTDGPMIVQAYGSYGISMLPSFNPLMAGFLREGGAYAVCHVRGGGELGESWRLGGKDANKHNTWEDLIACSEDLIKRHITTKSRLFIYGGSGGGIAVGRAATDRPDLFAGVIDKVPPANMVRLEAMPDGALETQEFGSSKDATGFSNLLMMDTYQHVREGVRYPPFLISMGLNDPRIAAWQPAKLAARLLEFGNPTLLRVEVDGGHGVGATRSQLTSMWVDFLTFAFWQSGKSGWQPGGTEVPK
jgi:prolyl oligopeptidase